MIRNYQAANELHRVSTLSAFNVKGAVSRRKVNQHATLYSFADGSRMKILSTRSLGSAWHKDWKGTAADVELGPVCNLPIKINR